MRFSRLGEVGREVPVVLTDQGPRDVRPVAPDLDRGFWIGDGPRRVREALAAGRLPLLAGADDLRRGTPVARPGKLLCVGANHPQLLAGAGDDHEPVVSMKDPATLVGCADPVVLPLGATELDWEVELGVVIGRPARYLPDDASAAAVVGGYLCSLDLADRRWQGRRGGESCKGRNSEGFNPTGPVLVTADEVAVEAGLDLATWVRGRQRQRGNTRDLVVGVAELIRYTSWFMPLVPGDVVNTGTPPGSAASRGDGAYLRVGDDVRCSVQGIGEVHVRIVEPARPSAAPVPRRVAVPSPHEPS